MPFFGCRVLKSDRWYGRVLLGIKSSSKVVFMAILE
jgi:hypothetical protein